MAETISATNTNTADTTITMEPDTGADNGVNSTNDSAEVARLKAEIARQKAAIDKATKEAGDAKKALRAKQTAEEAQAEIDKERQEAIERELKELRQEKAVSTNARKIMGFIPDEAVATSIATSLYGAGDVDAAIDEIKKAWVAREKALRMEYGKVPAPGVGSGDGPTITLEQLNKMKYVDRVEFRNKHPEEYQKLMGRG